MLIQYCLRGSKCSHIGVFDTNGFWAKYMEEKDGEFVDGYKIFSHFSFDFYHENQYIAEMVYDALIGVLSKGKRFDIEGVGFIAPLNLS